MAAGTDAIVVDELIEMRGLRFHFRDWPSKRNGAPSLVLLHGYSGHARLWDAFAEAMTDRYRVLALDQRGRGETGWAPDGRYAVGDMTDDLESFVHALGLKDFTLVGLSMGGLVAMDYAGRKPKALAACVIVDIGPEVETTGSDRIETKLLAPNVFESRADAFADARAANSRPPEAIHRHHSDASLMLTQDGRWTFRSDPMLRSTQSLQRPDSETAWRIWANIDVPIQVIRGELSDVLSQTVAERMIQTKSQARLAVVPNAGHFVPVDAPDGFLAAAGEFLKG
jgi:pimeloyl-ACP methyl ester carboxylesterase